MTQTAVEWLIKRYHDYGTLYYENMTKAKEMEKQQSKKDFIAGMEFIPVDPNRYEEDAEEYYNETYNKIEPTQSKEPTPEVFYAGWLGLFQNREDLKK